MRTHDKPPVPSRMATHRMLSCRGDYIACRGVPGCEHVQGGAGCPLPSVALLEVRGAEKGARRRHVRVLGAGGAA